MNRKNETVLDVNPISNVLTRLKEFFEHVDELWHKNVKNQQIINNTVKKAASGIISYEYPASDIWELYQHANNNFFARRKDIFDKVIKAAQEGHYCVEICEQNLFFSTRENGNVKQIIDTYAGHGYTFCPHTYNRCGSSVTGIIGYLYWMPADEFKKSYSYECEKKRIDAFYKLTY